MGKQDNQTVVLTDNSSLELLYDSVHAGPRDLEDIDYVERNNLLQIAEMLVLYDKIFIDNVLLAALDRASAITESLKDIVIPIEMDSNQRLNAAQQAIALGKRFPGLSSFYWYGMGDACSIDSREKEFLAKTFKTAPDAYDLDKPEEVRALIYTTSGGCIYRALYYYFLSRFAGYPYAPFVLRSPLYKMLLKLQAGKRVNDFVQEKAQRWGDFAAPIRERVASFSKAITEFVEAEGRKFREEMAFESDLSKLDYLELSAVGALIYHTAQKGRTSILEAALKIRDASDARAYRRWAGEFEAATVAGDADKVDRCRYELREACKLWSSTEGITRFKDRKIVIGSFINIESILKDKILPGIRFLNRKKHLLFLHDIWKQATL